MVKSYVELIIDANDKHEANPFPDSALLLYHAILARFNRAGREKKVWPKFLKINNQILRGSIRKSYNTYKAALESLKEREMIDYRSKNGYRDIILSLEAIPEGVTASDKISNDGNSIRYKNAKVAANPEEPETTTNNNPVPGFTSGPEDGVIRRQPPSSSSPPNEIYSLAGDHPPDDGISRNWADLKRNLNELNIPPGDYQKIVQLSDYGRKRHPVWKAFHEINRRKGSKDAVKNPGSWIQWYIKQAPPPAVGPAPSSPPESPDIPADRPPNDGAERDWDKLKSRLKELKCPPVAINRIAVLSGYGKIDNPVWDAVKEIRNKGDDIPQPGKWIIDYIRENTS